MFLIAHTSHKSSNHVQCLGRVARIYSIGSFGYTRPIMTAPDIQGDDGMIVNYINHLYIHGSKLTSTSVQ